MTNNTVRCGDANPNGNISFYFKGSCKKELPMQDAFRCTGCGGWFHRECIFEHFESEEGHSKAHNALRKIKQYIGKTMTTMEVSPIKKLCNEGLDRSPPSRSFLPI